MVSESYKTSFVFSQETRPKITKLQSILEENEKTSVTKTEALEKAISFYLDFLEKEA